MCYRSLQARVQKKPKLNKLNSNEWKKTKSRVRTAIQEIAKDLVLLYAKRQQMQGYAFSQDTPMQNEFEELFPYEETQDQLKAIEDTKRDMESTKIMDRLICGDVGYGKTEIALRAAFKAVNDSKQVWLFWFRQRSLHSSITTPLWNDSVISRSLWRCCHVSVHRHSKRKHWKDSKTEKSTLSSEHIGFCQKMLHLKISDF